MVSEVTALFTTGKGIAGERTTSALGRQNAGLPCHHERPDPRRAGPRGTGSTVRFGDRRDSNPRFPRAAQRGGKQEARSGKAATGNTKCINSCRGALVRNGRAAKRTPSSPPRHRWTARMPRAPFPPAGPALRTGAPKRHAVPGSGSPMPPKAADSGRSAAAGRHEKPLRSGRSGGVRNRQRTCRFRSAGAAPMSRLRNRRRRPAVPLACA
jgi:hypothetical protein